MLANSVGVADSDFRGEIIIKLTAIDLYPSYYPGPGDRIAQLVVVPCPQLEVEEVSELDETDRGAGGFGSTGK
jgi:dUTP pyrophosphatase